MKKLIQTEIFLFACCSRLVPNQIGKLILVTTERKIGTDFEQYVNKKSLFYKYILTFYNTYFYVYYSFFGYMSVVFCELKHLF